MLSYEELVIARKQLVDDYIDKCLAEYENIIRAQELKPSYNVSMYYGPHLSEDDEVYIREKIEKTLDSKGWNYEAIGGIFGYKISPKSLDLHE